MLTVEPAAGTTFRLRDGSLRMIAEGSDRVTSSHAPGLYQIEWRSAGRLEQEIFRLEPGEEVTKRAPMAWHEPEVRPPGAAEPARSSADLAALVDSNLRPANRLARSSSIAVIVDTADMAAPSHADPLQLIDWNDAAVAPDDDGSAGLPSGLGAAIRSFSVNSGRYRLRFRSVTGENWEQSVPALAGRRTVVSLHETTANLIMAEGDTFRSEASTGIDASKTVIVSIIGDESAERIHERIRLAGVLMHDLATGGTSLSKEFVAILEDPATDPLLRLYASLIVVARLSAGASPGLEASASEATPDPADDGIWIQRAAHWVDKPSSSGLPTDATAMWWQLERIAPFLADRDGPSRVHKRIEVPPMFERSWQWAIAHSVDQPRALPNTALNLATGRSASGTAPWLCWKTAASKAAAAAVPAGTSPDSEQLAGAIVAKVEQLPETETDRRNVLDRLTPDARDTIDKVLRAGLAAGANALLSGSLVNVAAIAPILAVNLGLPAAQLRRKLAKVNNELDRAMDSAQPPTPEPEAQSKPPLPSKRDAPGLRLRIEDRDDPHKGRFGGRASRRDYHLRAQFEAVSRNWTRITLTVSGPAEDGDPLYVYLHDSFRPPDRTLQFRKGSAEVIVTAWGGFTVGAWIPGKGIELELDLAKCKGAPKAIKTR